MYDVMLHIKQVMSPFVFLNILIYC